MSRRNRDAALLHGWGALKATPVSLLPAPRVLHTGTACYCERNRPVDLWPRIRRDRV